MDHSLNDIATQIQNAVYGGLKAPKNYSLSLQQIKDEFAQERYRQIVEQHALGQLNPEEFMQNIKKLPVAKRDFADVDGQNYSTQEYHAVIPEIVHIEGLKSVSYISTLGKSVPFKVIWGQSIFDVKYDKYSAKAPTIWIQDKNLWLLNPPVANIQNITFRAILKNPRAINGIAGQKFSDDDPYPCPLDVVTFIRNKMVWDYIKQYRVGNMQPALMAGDLNINSSPSTK